MLNYCVGEVGLQPDQFWSMTWTEVDAACRGYEIRLARSRELDRFIAAVLVNANRKPKSRAITPQEIIPLITDERSNKVEPMSMDEYKKLQELFAKVKWQIKN